MHFVLLNAKILGQHFEYDKVDRKLKSSWGSVIDEIAYSSLGILLD